MKSGQQVEAYNKRPHYPLNITLVQVSLLISLIIARTV